MNTVNTVSAPSMNYWFFGRGLSENGIKQISTRHLRSITYGRANVQSLNLSNNAIEYIQPGALSGLQELVILWVQYYLPDHYSQATLLPPYQHSALRLHCHPNQHSALRLHSHPNQHSDIRLRCHPNQHSALKLYRLNHPTYPHPLPSHTLIKFDGEQERTTQYCLQHRAALIFIICYVMYIWMIPESFTIMNWVMLSKVSSVIYQSWSTCEYLELTVMYIVLVSPVPSCHLVLTTDDRSLNHNKLEKMNAHSLVNLPSLVELRLHSQSPAMTNIYYNAFLDINLNLKEL